jgi:hypothetical protein
VSVSSARKLLELAEGEPERLQRHLLLAAALREVLRHDPIVVGGTAEEFWTQAEYHETDLDLCAPITREDEAALARLGFERTGRHWERPGLAAVVEFPDDRIDGDESRTVEHAIGIGHCRIIGLDDLYLDRLRQATIDERREGVEFQSALAVVAARYEEIEWTYVRHRLDEIRRREGPIADMMKRIDSRIRTRVRRALSQPDSVARTDSQKMGSSG